MTDKKLKPCPFCGSTRIADMMEYAACSDCGAHSGFQDGAWTPTAWNTRADGWQPIARPHEVEVDPNDGEVILRWCSPDKEETFTLTFPNDGIMVWYHSRPNKTLPAFSMRLAHSPTPIQDEQ